MNATEHAGEWGANAAGGATGATGATASTAGARRILVWDLPTRFFHWLLAISFAGAWLLSESERWRNVHVGFGYAALALVAVRLVWGLFGSRHARFAAFAFRPREALAYAGALIARRPLHYVGHNPLGGLAIVGLLVLALATGVTGYLNYAGIGGENAFEELHEGFATAWLVLVCVHVAGVIVGSLAHRENLARAMVTGYKQGAAADGIARPHALAGVAVAGIAACAFAWGAGAFGGAGPTATPDTGSVAGTASAFGLGAGGTVADRGDRDDDRDRD